MDGELQVFYVVPVGEKELASFTQRKEVVEVGEGGKENKKGNKLTRLVRRRESKRDRELDRYVSSLR